MVGGGFNAASTTLAATSEAAVTIKLGVAAAATAAAVASISLKVISVK